MIVSGIAVGLLALVLLAVQLAAVGFYLRHWGLRQARTSAFVSNEGTYFKRYIPPALRARYDAQRAAARRRWALRAWAIKAWMATTLVGGMLGVAAWALLQSWPHVVWTDLTRSEVAALDFSAHVWRTDGEESLPSLGRIVPLLAADGVQIATQPDDPAGDAIADEAQTNWQAFFSRNHVPVRACDAPRLAGCAARGVIVVPAGRWDGGSLERLLAAGASVLLYGPPLQTVRDGHPFEFHGLRFVPRSFPTLPQLALAGDRVLTLGFDAGLVLPIGRSFEGYVAISQRPQALGMSDDRFVGGELQTRLYAARVGRGRFVWMDFSPNARDHGGLVDARRLRALDASVFRYLLGRSYAAWATWPRARRFAGMLSVDAEDKFTRAATVASLARRLGMPITWFVLSSQALQYPGVLRQLASTGELACHGDIHVSFPLLSPRRQVVSIARCRKALSVLAHRRAIAFRPPYEEFDQATVDAVADNRMSYFFAVAGGDRAVPVLERAADSGTTLVSFNRLGADDFELWKTRSLDAAASIREADVELAWARALGGLLAFDFHTQFVSDEHLPVIRHYAERFREPDAYTATGHAIAHWWIVRDDLVHGRAIQVADACEYRPTLLRVDAAGDLSRIAEPGALEAALPDHGMTRRGGWREMRRECRR